MPRGFLSAARVLNNLPNLVNGTMYTAARLPLLVSARQTLGQSLCSARAQIAVSSLHSSALRAELQKFTMPAMSPTMQDGGIASWRKKEGEAYATGDVLLEIVCAWQWVSDR